MLHAPVRQTYEHMDQILRNYIKTFLGYGNFIKPFWFIGMEEGGGNNWGELELRFNTWHRLGAKPIEDLRTFLVEIGQKKWFEPPVRLQSTWCRLIRVYLGAERDYPINLDKIRDFQANRLGRNIEIPGPCIFELMPLPAPSTKFWPYKHLAANPNLVFLANRNTYANKITPQRIKLLNDSNDSIQRHQPKVVCFYGFEYLEHWHKLAGAVLQRHELPDNVGGFYSARQNGTFFVAMNHPARIGIKNAYFDAIGRVIADQM